MWQEKIRVTCSRQREEISASAEKVTSLEPFLTRVMETYKPVPPLAVKSSSVGFELYFVIKRYSRKIKLGRTKNATATLSRVIYIHSGVFSCVETAGMVQARLDMKVQAGAKQ